MAAVLIVTIVIRKRCLLESQRKPERNIMPQKCTSNGNQTVTVFLQGVRKNAISLPQHFPVIVNFLCHRQKILEINLRKSPNLWLYNCRKVYTIIQKVHDLMMHTRSQLMAIL